jgi:nitrogen regulatory protein PII
MKKIEATIDPATLDAVKLHLAEGGIGGRLTVFQANGLEDIARFYQLELTGESTLKPCLRLELIVSDRQTQSAVNVILQHARPTDGAGTHAHIDIVALDATLQNAPEQYLPAPAESRKLKKRGPGPSSAPPEVAIQSPKVTTEHG